MSPGYPVDPMTKLTAAWHIGEVEIPSRIVLAPMAGVSVQAFRRQGRRYGAGLVCSEMVSSCGLSYGNERTLGYLRIARDEHPLAVQIFGSEAERMAEAAGMVVDAGADIVDINMGCPVRKVTKTGAGASALEDHELACRVAGAVVEAVDVPVTVKMRRGLKNGSRAALDLGPRLEDLGVAALTLHPRSAQQMYTGFADHTLTAELVDAGLRARHRLRRHRRPGDGRAGARRHRRRRRDGRPRRAGPAVGAARDGRRGQRGRRPRRGGRRARPVHARGGARDGRGARGRVPPQVLRVVPARRRRRPGAAQRC